ncbi:hypothetical protein [uncultured Lactobacillus sp.]|uniref:hypothetical protein n=1 Tax=uncultured Lactobacillus sp. TaxID=153152 RepID=UPI002614B22D|nr:hypothetical protein [uncultured Lactobacillus sp.]
MPLDESTGKIIPVDLIDNQFIDKDTGQAMLPSLVNPEDELNFKIKRDFYIDGYATLRESVKQIRQYEIADQYNAVLSRMDGQEEYWLKFIGMFKSVQKLQLKREARIFSDVLSEKKLNKKIDSLLLNGLIAKWKYHHPINDSDISVYTLSGNGYRFLKTFYSDGYFHPQSFFSLNPRYHLRFWETLDVYQLLISLPVYHESTTLFRGEPNRGKPLLPSPLQVNLDLSNHKPKNLIFYPALHNDNEAYYKDAVAKWADYIRTADGNNIDLNLPVNDLPVGQNVLSFYTPTLKRAYELNNILHLRQFAFPSLFLVGTQIAREGLTKAFYIPNRENDELRQLNSENILLKRDRHEM